MFQPKLSFSFHAEGDRAVHIAKEKRFRIKENKNVFCEVAMRVVARLTPTLPYGCPLGTVTTGCWDLPKFLPSSILGSTYRYVCVHTHA